MADIFTELGDFLFGETTEQPEWLTKAEKAQGKAAGWGASMLTSPSGYGGVAPLGFSLMKDWLSNPSTFTDPYANPLTKQYMSQTGAIGQRDIQSGLAKLLSTPTAAGHMVSSGRDTLGANYLKSAEEAETARMSGVAMTQEQQLMQYLMQLVTGSTQTPVGLALGVNMTPYQPAMTSSGLLGEILGSSEGMNYLAGKWF